MGKEILELELESLKSAESEQSSGEFNDFKVEKEGDYSVISWTLHDAELKGDISFILRVNNKTGELAERRWTKVVDGQETLLRQENFEAEESLSPSRSTAYRLKKLEEEALNSLKNQV